MCFRLLRWRAKSSGWGGTLPFAFLKLNAHERFPRETPASSFFSFVAGDHEAIEWTLLTPRGATLPSTCGKVGGALHRVITWFNGAAKGAHVRAVFATQ